MEAMAFRRYLRADRTGPSALARRDKNMNRFKGLAKGLVVATSCFVVLSAAATSLQAQKTVNASWIGYEGSWTTASGWSCNCVPNNSSTDVFNVSIPQYGFVLLDNSSNLASATINSFTLSGGLLAVENSESLDVVRDINNNNNGNLGVYASVLTVGGNVNNHANLELGNGDRVTVAGTVTNAGSVGTITVPNNSSFSVGPDSTLQMSSLINGNSPRTQGDFSNSGTVTVSGDVTNGVRGQIIEQEGPASAPATISVGGNLTNHSELDLQDPATLTGLDVSGNLTNSGKPHYPAYLDVDGGRARVNGEVSNSAFVGISPEGSLSVGDTYTTSGWTHVEGTLIAPTVDIAGGKLDGSKGTIQGNVVNSAILSPVDPFAVNTITEITTLTIDGNYAQKAGGTLLIDVSSATDFSILDVSGEALLDGTAKFDFLNGYTPGANTDFAFLKAGSVAGDFTSLDFKGIKCPSCTFNLSTLSLDTGSTAPSPAVPEPSTVMLLGTGLVVLALLLRKKQRSVQSCS
jgi:hypothetical protein